MRNAQTGPQHFHTTLSMRTAQRAQRPARNMVEHFDVLIVGAGISGIDAAYHLQQRCPGKSFALLENQESFGGTWITHKFPGIRSDSDLFTFGYKWKPWTGVPIATAEEILKYLGEAIEEQQLGEHIRYGHEVKSATWSSDDNRWTLDVACDNGGKNRRFTCNFFVDVPGLLPACRGVHAGLPGHGSLSRSYRPSADLAG